jgi:hypothetical protein
VLEGNGGFYSDSPYNRLYNTSTIITFKGKVTGKQVAPPMKDMANAITLMVKSNGKTYQVDVGPEWYVNNQLTQIKVGDNIQVTGSRVTIDGHQVILAEQIVKGKSVLALRRPMGRPYWDAIWTDTAATDSMGNRVVSGQIVGVDTFVDPNFGPLERLTIHTDQGDVQVALAPEWYIQRQAAQFAVGSQVDVNSWAPFGRPQNPVPTSINAPIVFASAVGYNGQRIFLRGPGGAPLWFGGDGNLHGG